MSKTIFWSAEAVLQHSTTHSLLKTWLRGLLVAALLLAASGSAPPRLSAQESPLVLAFYYAWFDQGTWQSGRTAGQPVQPYASADPATIERHVTQAQQAGIDALIQSWYGPQERNNQTETNFRTLLDVAAAKGLRAAVDFETTGPFFPDQAAVSAALSHLLAVHARHPAYLRYQGKPVVFFWRQQRFSVEQWAGIRRQVDPNHDSLWIAEGVDIAYQSVFDGHHLYSVAWSGDPAGTMQDWAGRVQAFERENGVDRLWVATAMPGYDDTRLPRANAFAVPRRDGAYYRETWQAAIASRPDMVVITSFNEWLEGTQLEPATGYGDRYLALTAELAAQFKAGAPAAPPPAAAIVATPDSPAEPYLLAEEVINVRAGPGLGFPRIGRLLPGQTVRPAGRAAGGDWWQIPFAGAPGSLGWVAAEVLTLVGDPAELETLPAVQVTPAATAPPSPTSTATATPSPAATATPAPTPAETAVPPTATPTINPAPWPPPIPTETATPRPTMLAAATVAPASTPSPTPPPVPTATATPPRRLTWWWLAGGLVIGGGVFAARRRKG